MINQIITSSMFVLFGWFISHYAKSTMPRLIWSSIGIYFIVTVDLSYLLYAPSTYLGLGILLPHFRFLYGWINSVVNTLKILSKDTYYFFITVYYKTRNTFYWFIDFYEKIQAFFYGKKNKKAYEKFYKDDGYKYEEPKREQKQERTYKQEAPKSEPKKDYGKYGRFDDKDPYVVLGVSRSDDLKTIKKIRRELQHKYHTDKNHNESAEVLKKYTEITQFINNAWDEIQKEKK